MVEKAYGAHQMLSVKDFLCVQLNIDVVILARGTVVNWGLGFCSGAFLHEAVLVGFYLAGQNQCWM